MEDADTATWLREHGCDIGQGYYFGRPAAAAAIAQLMRNEGVVQGSSTTYEV